MFCAKCGNHILDNASFCPKCGNQLKKESTSINTETSKITMSIQNTEQKKTKRSGIAALFTVLAVVIVAMIALASKPSIYGTWSNPNQTIIFAFLKDGRVQMSGKNNIFGADVFQYTIGKDTICLQMKEGVTGTFSFDMNYELSKDMLTVIIEGYELTLYRMKDADIADKTVDEVLENTLDIFQIHSLYGTWYDSTGMISITFREDNTVRIAGLEDTIGVSAFTFSEYDDDTLQLKADVDNALIGMMNLNMDYEISGDTLTVTIVGQSICLTKRK